MRPRIFSKDAVYETSILPNVGDKYFKTNDVIQCESVNNKNKNILEGHMLSWSTNIHSRLNSGPQRYHMLIPGT